MMPSLLGVGAGSLWKGETGLLFIGFGTAFLTEYLRRWRSESDVGFTIEAYVVA